MKTECRKRDIRKPFWTRLSRMSKIGRLSGMFCRSARGGQAAEAIMGIMRIMGNETDGLMLSKICRRVVQNVVLP